MNHQMKEKIIRLQEIFVGDVLTLAEIGLQPEQFRQFKKKVFQMYHDKVRPETIELIHIFEARTVQQKYSGAMRDE